MNCGLECTESRQDSEEDSFKVTFLLYKYRDFLDHMN
jgi:hypothetical protein